LRTSDSQLSEDITSHRFPKKFIMPSFECYYMATDPIQHLRQYQDKMAVHSHDNLLLSRVFPSSLKGASYDCFYSLLRHSLWSFEEVKHAFYHQYASRWEFKNFNPLLTIKMKPRKSLKHYVSYFQSQITLVDNCNDDVVVVVFISGLQVSYSFYKHLVKHEVIRMRDILSQAQSTYRSRMRPRAQSIAFPKGMRRRSQSQNLPSQ